MYFPRYCLNYKGIPYKTEWIEYPDIETHCQKLGIAPTTTKRDGSPYYTLPAIHDPSTGVYMADSLPIAEYLEAQYPGTPSIFPHGTHGVQASFEDAYDVHLKPMWKFVSPAAHQRLSARSQEYYRRTREPMWSKKLEDIAPKGEKGAEEWAKVEAGMGKVAQWYALEGGPFLMGEELSWADVIVGSHMQWFCATLGEDSKEWNDIISWHGGFWKNFCEALSKYEAVD